MKQKRLYKIFIWGFLFLYLLVAAISFFHAIQFFSVGNNVTMSVVLAFAFEVGLALSLTAVLLSDANRKTTLPWILMVTLTVVQVIGNVFSTYKYMSLSETEYYQYLAKPLLFWIEGINEDMVQIVVSWIIGAILPIIALFMTDMVATNIKNLNNTNNLDKQAESVKEKETDKVIPIPANYMSPADSVKNESNEINNNNKIIENASNKKKTDTEDINDINEGFRKPAVSKVEIPAEKTSLLKKIGDGLKNLWTKE